MTDPLVVELRREADPLRRYRLAAEQLRRLRALVEEVEVVRAEAVALMSWGDLEEGRQPMVLREIAPEIGLSIAMTSKLLRRGEASLAQEGQ